MSDHILPPPAGPIARRALEIQPFYVMEVLSRAHTLESQGRDIVHMEVGEPDFPTPEPIIEAAQRYLLEGQVRYTPALGLPALREAIAGHYLERFNIRVDPARIVVTAGASGALLLTLAALTGPGQEWLIPDPGYPCNRHFVRAFEGVPVALPVVPENNFQPTARGMDALWSQRTRGAMIASPANPTGTLIAPLELAAINQYVRSQRGALIVDEIYQGLTYGSTPRTALEIADDMFVINSFSKYFGMTGWRLGWVVAPLPYVRELEKLAQHFFISPSSPAQHAALAAFLPQTTAILEARRTAFTQRRDVLQAGLEALGFHVPAPSRGAFYLYADVSALSTDSRAFALRLLEEAGVAITPGLDFGSQAPERWVRFAYTTDVERIELALARMRQVLS